MQTIDLPAGFWRYWVFLMLFFEAPFFSFAQTPQYLWKDSTNSDNSLQSRIGVPNGWVRTPIKPGSFAEFLRNLPLKKGNPQVLLFNGQPKKNQNAQLAVIDIDVGKRDLQQCADAVIRLRAEYLFQKKEFEKIHFKFVSGFNARWERWQQGFRPKIQGNQVKEVKSQKPNQGHHSFRDYLDRVFMYANSFSLAQEMDSVTDIQNMQIGDVFIQGGFPGHAVLVADMAQDANGKKIFLLVQSYMPAQDIHLLRNPESESPWYPLNFGQTLHTPEWTFDKKDLKRFRS